MDGLAVWNGQCRFGLACDHTRTVVLEVVLDISKWHLLCATIVFWIVFHSLLSTTL